MSSLPLVNYEVTLPGWYVYLICESLTCQNRHSIFLNLSVISILSKCENLVVRKVMFITSLILFAHNGSLSLRYDL